MEEKNILIEKYMADLRKIYPNQLLISKKQLTQLRDNSESTINREKATGEGIPYKQVNNRMVMFPLREVAAWMAGTEYTDRESLIDTYIEDILKIFPKQLLLRKKQLAQLRNVSESSLNREKANNEGISIAKEGNPVQYSARSIAKWISNTNKTT